MRWKWFTLHLTLLSTVCGTTSTRSRVWYDTDISTSMIHSTLLCHLTQNVTPFIWIGQEGKQNINSCALNRLGTCRLTWPHHHIHSKSAQGVLFWKLTRLSVSFLCLNSCLIWFSLCWLSCSAVQTFLAGFWVPAAYCSSLSSLPVNTVQSCSQWGHQDETQPL